MTDPQNWHSPADDARSKPEGDGQNPPVWGAPPAWTPPPRPGLIPLRPLGFGTLLWAPFQVLRRNPKATFGSALIVQGVVALVAIVMVGLVTYFALGRVDNAPLEDRAALEAGATLSIVLSALVPVALAVLASAMLQGIIVIEVARATLGEKMRLSALWRAVLPRLWPLLLWTILLSAALIAALALVVGLVVLLVSLGGAGVAFAVLTGVLGSIALIALGAWLITKTSLVPSVIVLERLGIRAAVARSWSLTQGYFWRTLGAQFLVALVVNIVSQIVTTPLSLLFGVATTLIDPNGSFEAYLPSILLYVLTILLGLVLGAVAAVVQSSVTALIYIDLRMRKEGLDLELARFVESAPGSSDDPYLTTPAVAPDTAWA
ncbi:MULTISPECIES: hypothetical protein [Cryobacterium]|uniref:Glycerophosphoryl diester phosphodiesterase membrane domain-containing protein n=1 Tax=Cryobacterium breve TaxID=1259258 RepID=A0ABY2J1D1_9MICO|nr:MULTISPECIES: hypothetical protein [Cryobacterium]TFC94125.1 hypothetical protein E3T20_09160 [Cryobacterium sp. TmT3-12]TFC98644.1 hypothetical protein E3O65_07130 [Cryobacterium breve]